LVEVKFKVKVEVEVEISDQVTDPALVGKKNFAYFALFARMALIGKKNFASFALFARAI